MAEAKCENCRFRAKFDQDETSILGRLWRWHINWCPGWKKYMSSVSRIKRMEIAGRYGLKNMQ